MRDAKFIELLNLYVDGEISPAQSADLEREILSDPRRREVYRQYCQLQRASESLNERFQAGAPVPLLTVSEVRRRVIRVRFQRAFWSTASLAAAACVAFMVMQNGPAGGVDSAPVLAGTGDAPGLTASVDAPAQSSSRASSPFTLVSYPFAQPAEARFVRALNAELRPAQAWSPALPLSPLEAIHFEGPVLEGERLSPSPRLQQGATAELTAFQFQR